jgi:hypothetical protein
VQVLLATLLVLLVLACVRIWSNLAGSLMALTTVVLIVILLESQRTLTDFLSLQVLLVLRILDVASRFALSG